MLHVNIRSVIINDMYMVIRMMCVTDWEGRAINNSLRDLSSKKGPILDF